MLDPARLVCPCCHGPLEDLACFICDRRFGRVDGQPVLVDFSTSILDEVTVMTTGAASPIPRPPRGRFHALHRALEGDNQVARTHITDLIELVGAGSVLVVGGATVGKGTEALYEANVHVTSFDVYATALTDLVADAHQIPFANETFDAVVVQAVLEHVLEPQKVVDEIHRVLKPNGVVYAETPFLQHVHEGPYDFTRFTESGHRWLFRRFARIDSGVVAGAGYQMLWSIDYLARSVFRSKRVGIRVRRLFALPMQLVEQRCRNGAHAVDAASAVYFFGRRCDHEISPAEIVAHYQGAQR